MGWGSGMAAGFNPRTGEVETRPVGYYVIALCDVPGCQVPIDRGLAWRCGELESLNYDGTPSRDDEGYGLGCGAYVCGEHELDHGCPNPRSLLDDDEDEDDGFGFGCVHGIGWDLECEECDLNEDQESRARLHGGAAETEVS